MDAGEWANVTAVGVPFSETASFAQTAGLGRISFATRTETTGNTLSIARLLYCGSAISKSTFKNCQSGSSYTRNLVGTSTVTDFNCKGPSAGTLAEKVTRGGSPGLAAIVPKFTFSFISPMSASE